MDERSSSGTGSASRRSVGNDRWLGAERGQLAADRILDAAAVLYAHRDVQGVGMNEVARAAGCSRATLYRYFENRDVLRLAFVHREARRLGLRVAAEVAAVDDPAERLVMAVEAAIAEVRTEPVLAAWFSAVNIGIASEIASGSAVIESFTAAFLGDVADQETRDRAGWVVRIVLSLLTMPGGSAAEERSMIERFVVPVIVA